MDLSREVCVVVGRMVRAVCVVVALGVPQYATAQERDYLVLGAGWFDAVVQEDVATAVLLEYRPDYTLFWKIKPFIGVMGTTDRSFYGYGGVLIDLPLGEFFPDTLFVNRLVVNISGAVGYYDNGDGKDLGHDLEFRTGLEVAYEFDNHMRIGAAAYHMSNTGIGDENPGTEIISVFFAVPL